MKSWLERWKDEDGNTLYLGDLITTPQNYDEAMGVSSSRSREKAAVHHFIENHYTNRKIFKSKEGKPFFEGLSPHFNYSHSKDYFFWGESVEFPIGVDTESFRDQILKIAPKFCAEREINWAQGTRNKEMLTLIWSAKEAIFKAYGWGNIDFRKQIELYPIPIKQEGSFTAKLQVESDIDFKVHYRFLDQGVCTWTLCKELQQKGH